MVENIYKSPESEILLKNQKLKRYSLGKNLAIISSIIQLAVVAGFLKFAAEMFLSFQSINLYGTGDPKIMAGAISSAMIPMIIGCVLGLPGFIMSITTYFISAYRSKWFFRYSITLSVFWILSFPVGTLFGIILMVVAIIKRKMPLAPEVEIQR